MVNSTSKTASEPSSTTTTTTTTTGVETMSYEEHASNKSSKKSSSSMADFVESSFASIERLCNPISTAVEDIQAVQKKKMKHKVHSNNNSKGDDDVRDMEQKARSNSNSNSNNMDEDDEEAYATLTYLALLTSLYLPLLLFLWIRRSMFGTASLCRSLFLGHMLRLVLAFMLLPPSTTKTFIPTWLWNFGLKVGHTAERLWKDKRTQAMIPTWFHLVLAFLLGIENDNIPSSATLANLGSNNEKDTWPPPALVALGVFTFAAFVVHPDGLTWIMVGQIRKWIQGTFEKTTDGIRMIQDGTIKITLAEMSGVLAGIIIIVTIVRAVLFQIEPTEKVRTIHREKKGHKHKKGKKGKGGRHHHNHQRTSEGSGNGSGGRGRIRSGHYRSAKDMYESTPRSRSPSPSTRDRSDSDMEHTTVSAVSDSGNRSLVETTTTATTTTTTTNNKHSDKKSSNNSNVEHSAPCVDSAERKTPNQSPGESKKLSPSPSHTERKPQKQSPAGEDKPYVVPSGSRSRMSTKGEKQKRGHGRKGRKSKQNNASGSVESAKSNEGNLKISTPTRLAKSDVNTRKSNSEDRYRNHKTREFECDATVGSNASYSNSDSQNHSNSSYFSSTQVAAPIHENKKLPDIQNRRRSLTDPHTPCHAFSPSLPQPLNVSNQNIATPPLQMTTFESERNDLMRFQAMQQISTNAKPLSYNYSGANESSYDSSLFANVNHNRQELGSFARSQVNSHLDMHPHGPVAGKLGPVLRGLNGAVIRPPPGLVPSQNPVGSSSVFAHKSNESNQQSLPYLSSSSMSAYSNFSSNSGRDMTFNASQTSSDRYTLSSSSLESFQRNAALPPISPLNRSAPAPIGHGRARKIHNDEEIEADLLALGGEMAGSILDF